MNYHAHVFFDLAEEPQIQQLRIKLCERLSPEIFMGRLLLKAVGPLPKPMFQMEFEQYFLDEVILQLTDLFSDFPVLIHPLIEDEYLAHTEHARWFGERLTLNLSGL